MTAYLTDLQRYERGHPMADRRRVHIRPVAGQHAAGGGPAGPPPPPPPRPAPPPPPPAAPTPRATPSRLDASSIPTRGSAASKSMSLASSSSITGCLPAPSLARIGAGCTHLAIIRDRHHTN